MSQPTGIGGRPLMPAPGSAIEERRIARFHRHARALVWPVLVLIAVCGAVGFLWGNLPAPFHDWMLFAAAGALVFLFVLLPYASWWAQTYTLTTERVMARRGVFRVRRAELAHARGYTVAIRRGILQRMWGAGTLTLSDGVDAPMVLRNIPSVALVHETLVDQVEVSQILAHRDAGTLPTALP